MRSRAASQTRRRRRPLAVLALFTALSYDVRAWADGGAVQLQEVGGPFLVTLFAPQPLRRGAADLSVLVQSAASREVLLDTAVDLALKAPASDQVVHLHATRAAATDKLLQAGLVELNEEGTWGVQVEVRRGGDVARVAGTLQVEGAAPPLTRLWPYLALPPVAVLLFGLGQVLARRRKSS